MPVADDAGPVDAEPEIIAEVEEELAVDQPAAEEEVEPTVVEEEERGDRRGRGGPPRRPSRRTRRRPAGGGRSIRGAEGARLIALNMALNGTPRDETARYLSQNFDLDDQDSLLDEVYARVGG